MVSKIKPKHKPALSEHFKELKKGESVSVVKQKSVDFNFPERLQGRTGLVQARIGHTYMVAIKDQNKEKKFLIAPVHLKKIKN